MISKNLAQGIVLTAPSPATSGTSVVVRSGEGSYYPTPPFLATAAPPDQLANPAYAEIVLVTAISTDTLTIVRNKRSSGAKSIAVGWIIANGIYTENVLGVDVTVSTAAATATKVGATSQTDYTPTLGDILNVTFSNGNTVTTPTLNIDGSGAKNIRLGNANVTTAFFNTGSAITLRLWYDGTYYQMFGSLLNTDTTYSEISQAEITNTASTTTRLITGRRAENLMVNEASVARTMANKTLTSPVLNTGVSGTAIDTDGTLAANSDTKLASQKATKTYVDTKAGVNSLIRNEVPGGSVNSSNVTFTLASTPASGSLRLYKNGVRLKITDDYTLSGTTITMVSAPLTGDKLLADYETTSSVYSVGTNSIIVGEVPSGSVNGSNATFTLARAYIAGSLEVMINGLAQARTTHFTETTPASGVFTMGDAPLTGDIITVNYQYNLNPSSNADTVDGIHASSTPTANQLLALDSNAMVPTAALGGAWTSYTPVFTLTGASSQAMTVVGGYRQNGKTVEFWAAATVNGSSNFTGLSSVFCSLPVPATANMYNNYVGVHCKYLDNGVAWYTGAGIIDGASSVYMMASTASGSYVSNVAVTSAIPFGWGLNDRMIVNGTYEAA